jgi:hypothetical protein
MVERFKWFTFQHGRGFKIAFFEKSPTFEEWKNFTFGLYTSF